MIGSESLVLEVRATAGALNVRLWVDGEVAWEAAERGRGPLFVGADSVVRSSGLAEALGSDLYEAIQTELDGYDRSRLVIMTPNDELSLARWGELGTNVVVDYSGWLSERALVPIELPVSVLLADIDKRYDYSEYRAHPMHHFATTALGFVGVERLERTLERTPHDIVHLRTRVVERAGEIWLGTPTSGLPADRLGALLRRRGEATRLLILEVDGADTDAALLLARKIRRRTGPTVLVTDDSTDFREFYYAIAHSSELRYAVQETRNLTSPADRLPRLFIPDGGDEALVLFSAEVEFRRRVASERVRLREVESRGARVEERLAFDDLVNLEALSDLELAYYAESAGLEPMSDASIALSSTSAVVRSAERRLARVVNTWFSSPPGTPIAPKETLQTETAYRVNVSVGPPAPQSNIAVPFQVDEQRLADVYEEGGSVVRAVLISDDLEIAVAEKELRVPRPPAPSATLSFDVTTPPTPQRIAARLALYAGNNLLQSVALEADVNNVPTAARANANTGRVDWVLRAQLDDHDRLGPKAISVLTNDLTDGTHLVAVEGTDFRTHVTLGETQVTNLLDQARGALQWAAGDPGKDEEYRYLPDHGGTREALRIYLTGIAEFGWDLYTNLITQHDPSVADKFETRLAAPSTIQCARTGSSRLMYPWALVYDHPIIPDRGNELCCDFLAAASSPATIEASQCFTGTCSNKEDTNVVCPSGFWGFRHVIEQPLGSFKPEDEDVLTGQTDVPDVINVDGMIETFVGYSTDLDPDRSHVDNVLSIAGINGTAASALKDVGRYLQAPDLKLVYFFCHGGSRGGKAWLGVGGKPASELFAPNLLAWKIQWPVSRPLVFINGCETAAARPDDLATFNENLRYCRASGVIGSEIKIPVELGRAVGSELIAHVVVDRVSVGEAVRRVRLGLLAKFNPLGLAYTPYCLAKLHMA